MQNNVCKISILFACVDFSARKGNFLLTNHFNLATTIMVIMNRNEYTPADSSTRCNALGEILPEHNTLVEYCYDVNDIFHTKKKR